MENKNSMKHAWKKLRWFLLTFIVYFIFGMLITSIKSDFIWGLYAIGLFIGFPIYLFWIILSEIKYQIKNKKASSISITEKKASNDEIPLDSINSNRAFVKPINNNNLASTAVNPTITEQQNKVQENSAPENTLENLGIKVSPTPVGDTTKNKSGQNIIIHHLRRKLYNFVVVDTETTGLDKNAKIIQLSAIRYEHDKPVETFNEYINPEILPLPEKITTITGIDNQMLQYAPKFKEISNKFMEFVGTLPWIGHNINSFDIPRLVNNGLPLNEVSTIDTLNLARKKLHMSHYGLEDLKHYYGIQNKSHNSLEDCKTNAIVYQHLRDDILTPVTPDYSNIKQSLAGLSFAISGSFAGYSRKDVEELVKSHGGSIKSTVTHDTDYLVDGKQISDSLTDGIHSSKELKARDYGTNILSLSELHSLIKGE
ncbi:hypothetical protein EUY87_00785 [Lactobacillus reuteri]|nr:hypothetical protein [Limosilactobacillus reuteri]